MGHTILYFVLGGTIVSVSTYLGSQGRSFLAAFASTFPAITGATFILIYLNGGNEPLSATPELPLVRSPMDGLRHRHDSGRPAIRLLAGHGPLVLYMGCVGLVKLCGGRCVGGLHRRSTKCSGCSAEMEPIHFPEG